MIVAYICNLKYKENDQHTVAYAKRATALQNHTKEEFKGMMPACIAKDTAQAVFVLREVFRKFLSHFPEKLNGNDFTFQISFTNIEENESEQTFHLTGFTQLLKDYNG